MLSYKEKFLDPRWQKKRLLILERDGFACCNCGDTESTLHVHHKFYIYGVDPWDYNDKLLETLCVECHEAESFEMQKIKDVIHDLMIEGWNYQQLGQYMSGLIYPTDYDKDARVRFASFVASTPEWLEKVRVALNKRSLSKEFPF